MKGRIAVITGALRGIGLETAVQLAKKGCQVVLTGRDESKGKAIQTDLAKKDFSVAFLPLDVADPKSIERFVEKVLGSFDKVDILVNNAGIFIDDKQTDFTLSGYAETINLTFCTNALGPFLLCQALVPRMVKNGFGRVVNVSSGLGQLANMGSGHPGYRMSKTAVNAVTRIFADQTRGKNVLINSASPGWTRTDMGGSFAPHSVAKGADTIVWLATWEGENGPSGQFFEDRKQMDW